MTILFIGLLAMAAFILLRVVGILYFRRYLTWETENRRDLHYYGKALAERRAFKEKIKKQSPILLRFLWLETKLQRKPSEIPSIEYRGVTGPRYSSTVESFQTAAEYRPTETDIFVATQMKCGTTWMQQIVYEILHKGNGDLSDTGHIHLDAVSPWIEAVDGVCVKDAPLLGAKGRRLIKTHLPTALCPYSDSAKYIYVTRHPVSCFASIVDYFHLMTGFLTPPRERLVDWFCSDRLWWLSWPDHVAGWWEWASSRKNVIFFHFEEMKKNLASVVRKSAQFLGENLTEEELAEVVRKSSFDYMKKNEELFEMSPPNLFSVCGTYFKSGQLNRHESISEVHKKRILDFCKSRLAGKTYPFPKFYPVLGNQKGPGPF